VLQDNQTLTRAYALLDRPNSGDTAIGTINLLRYERYIYMIITNPKVVPHQPAGYVHEIDPADFELRSDNIGPKKWMSTRPAKIIANPVVVTTLEVMKKVQIFVIIDPDLIKELEENRPKHLSILTRELERPLAERRIEWLNQTLEINPVRLPRNPAANHSETRP
jgi:hypothetical protein